MVADVHQIMQILLATGKIEDDFVWDSALSLSMELQLTNVVNGQITTTKLGKDLSSFASGQSVVTAMRKVLFTVLTTIRRDLLWIASAEKTVIRQNSPELYQTIYDLDLLPRSPDESVTAFWKSLREAGKFLENDEKLARGKQAEERTVNFEKQRLAERGFQELASQVTWVSQESDLHGYDVFSFMGSGDTPNQTLHIEVKSISQDSQGRKHFFLSRNEYEVSRKLLRTYVLYLWESNGIDFEADPIIWSAEQIISLIPEELPNSRSVWVSRIIYL